MLCFRWLAGRRRPRRERASKFGLEDTRLRPLLEGWRVGVDRRWQCLGERLTGGWLREWDGAVQNQWQSRETKQEAECKKAKRRKKKKAKRKLEVWISEGVRGEKV